MRKLLEVLKRRMRCSSMLWPRTLEKLTKIFLTLGCQLYKILPKSNLFLLSNLSQMITEPFWLQTIFWKLKEQVFWNLQPQTRTRMVLTSQKSLLVISWNRETWEISAIKNTWRSKMIFKIHHRSLRRTSTRVWSVF